MTQDRYYVVCLEEHPSCETPVEMREVTDFLLTGRPYLDGTIFSIGVVVE